MHSHHKMHCYSNNNKLISADCFHPQAYPWDVHDLPAYVEPMHMSPASQWRNTIIKTFKYWQTSKNCGMIFIHSCFSFHFVSRDMTHWHKTHEKILKKNRFLSSAQCLNNFRRESPLKTNVSVRVTNREAGKCKSVTYLDFHFSFKIIYLDVNVKVPK